MVNAAGGAVLAVVGTRVLGCRGDRDRAAQRIWLAVNRLKPATIISGGARGVDTLAEAVAVNLGYAEELGTLRIYRPTVQRFHGPGGYRERDQQMAQDCTHLLRIACVQATTYGSGWTADHAEQLGRIVVRDRPCPGES